MVAAESVFDGSLKSVGFPVRIAVKTDSNGHYELPHLDGIYKVSLPQAAETDDRLTDRFVVADEPPPLVLPQKVSVSGTEPQTIEFRAGPTLTVARHDSLGRWPSRLTHRSVGLLSAGQQHHHGARSNGHRRRGQVFV